MIDMLVLFATAELAPIASVGGLAAAAAGLVAELRRRGVDVDVVLPDYLGVELQGEERMRLDVPEWAGPSWVRRGHHPIAGKVCLVEGPGLARPHPYLQADGQGWPDNDLRFLAFSQAVAALCRLTSPDVLHLNDWHTAATLGALEQAPPTVLSIHNLAYQGQTDRSWLTRIGPRSAAYERYGGCNPLAGGLTLADAIVAVSPSYAQEIVEPAGGCGLHELLAARGSALVGILNGIDTAIWDPAQDPHLVAPFDVANLAGKQAAQAELTARLGLHSEGPLAVAVTRLTDQKGIDLLLPMLPYLAKLPLRVAVLGAGDADLAGALSDAAAQAPSQVAFVDGYDESLAHRLFAGGDLLLMPSRFEPCGLTQMQALRYGTLPLVTAVGGLRDTVVDLDEYPQSGTGWVAQRVEPLALIDATHRAIRTWGHAQHWRAAQSRAMTRDWSWHDPGGEYESLYAALASA